MQYKIEQKTNITVGFKDVLLFIYHYIMMLVYLNYIVSFNPIYYDYAIILIINSFWHVNNMYRNLIKTDIIYIGNHWVKIRILSMFMSIYYLNTALYYGNPITTILFCDIMTRMLKYFYIGFIAVVYAILSNTYHD